MTIASTARKAGPLLGNGIATSFSFGFRVFATGDVKVAIADSTGVETVLEEGTHYTVSLNANQETSPGGSVTYPVSGSPLPVGSVLSVIGDLDYDQPLDLPSGGNFSPLALENQLDRATIQIQQLKEQVDRAAKLPQTSAETPDALVFNITRLAESADNLDSVAGSLPAVNTVATDIASVNTVAGSISNVAATGANIAAVVTVANDLNEPVSEIETVAGSITNVDAVGSNIANVNTVADISASVTTVAGIVADVTTVADNVADITNFSDVYYGPSASDPTLRKDGSALQSGDLYFYTGSKRLRVFDGVAWVDGPVNAGTITRDTFSGTGAQTAFTLSVDPVSENNAQVFIGGVYQQKSEYSVSGTTLTFSAAPVAGTNNIEVLSTTTLALGTTDAALVGFQQAGAGAVARTAQSKMREIVSAKDFGAVGDGVADDTEALEDAIAYCRSTGAWLHGVGGEIYKVTDTLVFGSDTLAFVNFDGNGCEILVDSATDIYAIDTSGISSAYCECGVIQNVTIRNTPRTTMAEASGGILAAYSGTLKLRNVKVITHGSCVNGGEKISHQYVDCFFTGTNTRAKRGITGQHRNLNVVGGRVYACDVAVVLAGESISLSGVDIEFSNIALWSRALTTALIDSCHFETTKVLLTNADTLPSLTDVAWLDTTGDGAGCLGVTFQSCHVAMGGYAQAPLIVIKSGPSFSYGLTINDSFIQHNLNKIAGNFAPGTAEAIPSGSRLAMRGTGFPAYGTFPVDAYSRIQVLGGGSVLSSNTTMEMITLGKRASQSISASGGTLDFTTGYGQFSTAVFELHIRAAAPGYEYGCIVTAVQSYDKMTFTRLSALGAGSADADLTVSWVAASGTIRLTNNVAAALTIISSFVVKSVL